MADELQWMLITASPSIAKYAESCGVHRIFVDMEVLGKEERQKHLSAHKAAHTFEDIAAVSEVLTKAELMVRVNPLHVETAQEVNESIACGASRLMLPMFRSPEEVEEFIRLVDGRVPMTLLAETPQALTRISGYAELLGKRDEVHFGLNDLSLAMGLDFLFEPLAGRLLEPAIDELEKRNIAYGFGGVARLDSGELPAEWVLSEHVRLRSRWVILSRAFHGCANELEELHSRIDLQEELHKLRSKERDLRSLDAQELLSNHGKLEKRVFELARKVRSS
nr:aldolase/citrate lyase family protein [uncultured Halomonas sp.]